MSMWRIRITLSDDPRSHALLNDALAGQPVSQVKLTPAAGTAEVTGDVVVELTRNEGLGELLSALHTISPQVLVSRADPSGAPSARAETAVPRQVPRGRRLSLLRAGASAQDVSRPGLR
jgi:hypothetical protein